TRAIASGTTAKTNCASIRKKFRTSGVPPPWVKPGRPKRRPKNRRKAPNLRRGKGCCPGGAGRRTDAGLVQRRLGNETVRLRGPGCHSPEPGGQHQRRGHPGHGG